MSDKEPYGLSYHARRYDRENRKPKRGSPMSEDNKTPECLIPALRQYRHNRGNGLVAAYDYDLVNKQIATKDAELAQLREEKTDLIHSVNVLEIGGPESDEWIKGFEDCRERIKNLMDDWPK